MNISTNRPRLYVRRDENCPGRGLTLDALRARAKRPEYARYADPEVTVCDAVPDLYNHETDRAFQQRYYGMENPTNRAMRYLLYGDINDALHVGNIIAAADLFENAHTAAAATACNVATCFDWVCDVLPPQQREEIVNVLVRMGDMLAEILDRPVILHNYGYYSVMGLSAVAVALHGEPGEAGEKAVAWIKGLDHMLTGEGLIFETLRNKGGTWGEGNHYSHYCVFYTLLMALQAFETSGDAGYFDRIRNEYGDFMPMIMRFTLLNFRPDYTMERLGDSNWTRCHVYGTYFLPAYELLALHLEPRDCGILRSFLEDLRIAHGPGLAGRPVDWQMLCFCDADLPTTPSYRTLPTTLRSAPGGAGQVVMRTGWGFDDTQITLVAGEHYTNHQHFDKGHLLIYKSGSLTIDGGGYGGMYTHDHWVNYATRSLAHNTILIHDPKEIPYNNVAGHLIIPDGGQRVINHATGIDELWPDYENTRLRLGLSTSFVVALDTGPGWRYAQVNLTKAYGPKAKDVRRSLLFLDEADLILLLDSIESHKPMQSEILFHFEEQPEIYQNGNWMAAPTGIFAPENCTAIRVRRTGPAPINGREYNGEMVINPLLPSNATVYCSGGPGYEFFNRQTGRNFDPDPQSADAMRHPVREAGNYRVDIGERDLVTRSRILTAISLGTTGMGECQAACVRSLYGRMDGAHWQRGSRDYIVMMPGLNSDMGAPVLSPADYSVTTSQPALHVLCGLPFGTPFRIGINGKTVQTAVSSPHGVLCFTDEGVGDRRVVVTPCS